MKPIEIPAFGVPSSLGSLIQPPRDAVPSAPPPPAGVAKMVADNPLIAGGLILGGAYLAYKAGSLLGGLLAGGAALVYGPTVLDALTMPVVAQPGTTGGSKPICIDNCWDMSNPFGQEPVGPVQPTVVETQATCQAKGRVWIPTGGNGSGMCWDGQIANVGNVVK